MNKVIDYLLFKRDPKINDKLSICYFAKKYKLSDEDTELILSINCGNDKLVKKATKKDKFTINTISEISTFKTDALYKRSIYEIYKHFTGQEPSIDVIKFCIYKIKTSKLDSYKELSDDIVCELKEILKNNKTTYNQSEIIKQLPKKGFFQTIKEYNDPKF